MKQVELVFIPAPPLSHIIAAVETAKLLLERAERLSITVLIMNPFQDTTVETYTQKISNSNPRLRLKNLPSLGAPPTPSTTFIFDQVETRVAHVRQIVSDLAKQNPNSQLAGLVLDLFTTNFIDVADELGLPSYVFSTCGACYLGMTLGWIALATTKPEDLPEHMRRQDLNSETFSVPYLSVPVPAKVLPGRAPEGDPTTTGFMMKCLMRLPEVKGILVNTFHELEPYAIEALMAGDEGHRVYPVGPMLNSSSFDEDDDDVIKKWLDDQPEKSVIYVCFGSIGSLAEDQVREIALALENCGSRFLWSLKKSRGLPEGFTERTRGVGKVIKWAAQVAVLAQAAVGGFVSHCGWNSTLESVWNGVPIAAFPMFAEQHLNAFQMAEEVGVAEAITLDYQMDFSGTKPPRVVGWEEIAAVLRRMMAAEGASGAREKAEEMRKKARAAVVEGGSSYKAQNRFIEDVFGNIA